MKNLPFIILLALSMGVTSCGDEENGGPEVSVTHDPGFFGAVELITSSNITIQWAFDWSVVVDGRENDVNDTEVFVSGGTLIIRENGSIHHDQHITIFTPFLFSIKTLGSSNVSGDFEVVDTTPIYVYSYGSGNIDLQFDTANFMVIKHFGSGDVIISGQANKTDLELTGSGWIRTFGVPTLTSIINLTGSGNAEVHVADDLDVVLSGSGNVHYKGHPNINSQISGSGQIIDAN